MSCRETTHQTDVHEREVTAQQIIVCTKTSNAFQLDPHVDPTVVVRTHPGSAQIRRRLSSCSSTCKLSSSQKQHPTSSSSSADKQCHAVPALLPRVHAGKDIKPVHRARRVDVWDWNSPVTLKLNQQLLSLQRRTERRRSHRFVVLARKHREAASSLLLVPPVLLSAVFTHLLHVHHRWFITRFYLCCETLGMLLSHCSFKSSLTV